MNQLVDFNETQHGCHIIESEIRHTLYSRTLYLSVVADDQTSEVDAKLVLIKVEPWNFFDLIRLPQDENYKYYNFLRNIKNTNIEGVRMLKYIFCFMDTTQEPSHLDKWSAHKVFVVHSRSIRSLNNFKSRHKVKIMRNKLHNQGNYSSTAIYGTLAPPPCDGASCSAVVKPSFGHPMALVVVASSNGQYTQARRHEHRYSVTEVTSERTRDAPGQRVTVGGRPLIIKSRRDC
jgi:hypothetical protein